MGLTKTEIFTEKQNKLDSMIKAWSHPAGIVKMKTEQELKEIVKESIVRSACKTKTLINHHVVDAADAHRSVQHND